MSLRPPLQVPATIREFNQWCAQQITAWKEIFYTSVITPSQITADQDDYSPTGFSTCAVMRLSSDAVRAVTGLSGGKDGRLVKVYNVGDYTITLNDEDSSSVAANRFTCPGSSNFTIQEAGYAELWYDDTSSRWRVH